MSTKTIVVTRPNGQARQLIEVLTRSIEQSGVAKRSLPEIVSLPLLTIVPKTDDALADHIATALKDADLAISVFAYVFHKCHVILLWIRWCRLVLDLEVLEPVPVLLLRQEKP